MSELYSNKYFRRIFIKFGMIPELMGRVPVIVSLNPLDRDTLIRILQEPKNSIVKQYKKLFELDGVDLEFDDGAIEAIADKTLGEKDRCQRSACDHGTGYDGSDVPHTVR